MSTNVMVLAEHTDGKISDGTYELIGQARELAGALGGGQGHRAPDAASHAVVAVEPAVTDRG